MPTFLLYLAPCEMMEAVSRSDDCLKKCVACDLIVEKLVTSLIGGNREISENGKNEFGIELLIPENQNIYVIAIYIETCDFQSLNQSFMF